MLWAATLLVFLQPATPVKTGMAEMRTLRSQTTVVGRAEPHRRTTVAAEVEGKVKQVPVRTGSRVKKNDILAILDTDALEIQIQEATASLAEAQAELDELVNGTRKETVDEARALHDEAVAEVDRLKLDLQRTTELVADDVKSDDELQDARTALTRAQRREAALGAVLARLVAGARKEQIARAEARRDLRKAVLSRLQLDKKKSTVRAPFDGAVTELLVEEGSWVGRGGSVVRMLSLSPLDCTLPIPERYVPGLLGATVTIRADALPAFAEKAKVARIVALANPRGRTFPAIVELNKVTDLLPGMTVRAEIEVAQKLLTVPKDALVLSPQGTMIFAVIEGKAAPVLVRTGASSEGFVAIQGEIRPGTPVVVKGNERLRPGQPVVSR